MLETDVFGDGVETERTPPFPHLLVAAIENGEVIAQEGHSQDEDFAKLRFLAAK